MLTVTDLHDTLAHEEHLGWGYACLDVLSPSRRERIDRAIVAVANDLGLTTDELLMWSNSKHGRWLADRVHGNDASPNRATVRKELNADVIAALHAEVGQ